MTLQEAYNKGLDDAENNIIVLFERILKNEEGKDQITFPNPKLESLKTVINRRSDYYYSLAKRNNNIGKTFRNKIKEENEIIDNSKI